MRVNHFEKLFDMMMRHDLSHMMSDSGAVWRRGCDELRAIESYAATFGIRRAQFEALWNDMVLCGNFRYDCVGMFLKGEARREHEQHLGGK